MRFDTESFAESVEYRVSHKGQIKHFYVLYKFSIPYTVKVLQNTHTGSTYLMCIAVIFLTASCDRCGKIYLKGTKLKVELKRDKLVHL